MEQANSTYHIPAMLRECMEGLDIRPGGVYVDATFGGGGHSRAILGALGPEGRLFSFDRDSDAMANADIADPRFTFVHGNFRYMRNFLRYYGAGSVDGILADLGVSFHHFDDAERGFSFRADAPLDMRMNRRGDVTAASLLAEASPERLAEIFRLYGDIGRPAPIVRAITTARDKSPVDTTGRLADVVSPVLDPRRRKKELAQVFQALRIVVNDEMASLREFLNAAPRVLRPGGRLVVLTYHSLEDRMVKNFMRTGNVDGRQEKDFFGRSLSPWREVTRKALLPSPAEVEANPRSRSAKLRVAELIDKENG